MRERPILFSGPMVRAILDGRKTQTRRVVTPQPNVVHAIHADASITTNLIFRSGDQRIHCPYGQPGDRLWVRETFAPFPPVFGSKLWGIIYGADAAQVEREAPDTYRPMLYNYERWYPSIHMPRWACRLVLEIESIRVERLQEISGEDAVAEGVRSLLPYNGIAQCEFLELWDSINAKRGFDWDANPWVWVVEFKRATP